MKKAKPNEEVTKWEQILKEFKAIPFNIFYRQDRETIVNWFKDRTIPK